MGAIPGCVVRARKDGQEFSLWRCTASTAQRDGNYGSSPGATATVRVALASLPAGVTIADAQYYEVWEDGFDWVKYRVNGLASTMGMLRWQQEDSLT